MDDASVLVTGAAGLVGSWIVKRAPLDRGVWGITRDDVELSDLDAVLAHWREAQPALVVHTAYGTANLDHDVVEASANVVTACLDVGAELIHLSTDVVFDGEHGPYTEEAPLSPTHAYGRAKAAAETDIATRLPAAAVVRTSLVCWNDPLDPRSLAVVDGLRTGAEPVTLFTDELRNPVRVDDLADAIWSIAALTPSERSGPWHLVGEEAFSRYEQGILIARWAGLDPASIIAAASSSWTGPEPRPRDCRLTTERADAAGVRLRSIRTLFHPPPTRPPTDSGPESVTYGFRIPDRNLEEG